MNCCEFNALLFVDEDDGRDIARLTPLKSKAGSGFCPEGGARGFSLGTFLALMRPDEPSARPRPCTASCTALSWSSVILVLVTSTRVVCVFDDDVVSTTVACVFDGNTFDFEDDEAFPLYGGISAIGISFDDEEAFPLYAGISAMGILDLVARGRGDPVMSSVTSRFAMSLAIERWRYSSYA